MNKIRKFSILALCVVFVASSCKKDDEENAQVLVGTWKFVSLSAKTLADVTQSAGGYSTRTVTTSDYISTDNSGTLTITDSKIDSKDIAYTINSTMYAKSYYNGTLDDTFELPFYYEMEPTSSSATYKLIGSDSISFNGGAVVSIAQGGGTSPSQAVGGKYKLEGNKLTIFVKGAQTVSQTQSGATVTTKANLDGIVVYEKQ